MDTSVSQPELLFLLSWSRGNWSKLLWNLGYNRQFHFVAKVNKMLFVSISRWDIENQSSTSILQSRYRRWKQLRHKQFSVKSTPDKCALFQRGVYGLPFSFLGIFTLNARLKTSDFSAHFKSGTFLREFARELFVLQLFSSF